jgi:hypothetical protein
MHADIINLSDSCIGSCGIGYRIQGNITMYDHDVDTLLCCQALKFNGRSRLKIIHCELAFNHLDSHDNRLWRPHTCALYALFALYRADSLSTITVFCPAPSLIDPHLVDKFTALHFPYIFVQIDKTFSKDFSSIVTVPSWMERSSKENVFTNDTDGVTARSTKVDKRRCDSGPVTRIRVQLHCKLKPLCWVCDPVTCLSVLAHLLFQAAFMGIQGRPRGCVSSALHCCIQVIRPHFTISFSLTRTSYVGHGPSLWSKLILVEDSKHSTQQST